MDWANQQGKLNWAAGCRCPPVVELRESFRAGTDQKGTRVPMFIPRDEHCIWGVLPGRRQRARGNARFRPWRARQSLWCTRKMWHSARWFGCPDRSAQLMRPVRDA